MNERKNGGDGRSQKLRAILSARESEIKELTLRLEEKEKENSELSLRISALEEQTKRVSELEKLTEDCDLLLQDERLVSAATRNKAVIDAVVAQYLRALSSGGGVPVLGGAGSIPLTPAMKPKSLAEAKKLAEILIKG